MMDHRKILKFPEPVRDLKLARYGDAEVLRQQDIAASYERGRIDGERALSEQLVRQRGELLELQTGVLAELQRVFPTLSRDCEQALIALALEVARKLVAGLPVSVEMVEAAVVEACTEMEHAAEYCVRLNPVDFEMLQRENSPMLLTENGPKMRFETSKDVTRGGCMVETSFGVLDARHETRMKVLKETLLP